MRALPKEDTLRAQPKDGYMLFLYCSVAAKSNLSPHCMLVSSSPVCYGVVSNLSRTATQRDHMRSKHAVLWLLVGMLSGMLSAALAEEKKEHETLATILARQIQTILNANSVLGKPQDFAGTKIIPIVKMGFKF